MVEGPEYRRHAELLQVLVGQRLLRVVKAHPLLEQALPEFAGLRVLRVMSVGKEIFVIFESRSQIEVEDGALRMHLGESGGYVVTPKTSVTRVAGPTRSYSNHRVPNGLGLSWGPKAVKDSRNPNGQPPPETDIEFSDARFAIWDSLGSRYQVCPSSYVSTVEGRLHRDVSYEFFNFQESAHMIRISEMLVVDLVMNQAVLPGVGNIIKNEGLFRARLHPLRRGSSLTEEEAGRLVAAIYEFTQSWFQNCRKSADGAHMGCALPLCYGRSSCTSCSLPVALIKEGERKRLTFFCGSCQPPDDEVLKFLHTPRGVHRLVLPVKLPLCQCGDLPALQLFRKPGRDFGRLHAVCWRRRHANQPGCAGQHRRMLHGPKTGCHVLFWLDGGSSNLSLAALPTCDCGQAPIYRRAMGLRESGQVFARCTHSFCKWRLWLQPEELALHIPGDKDSDHVQESPAKGVGHVPTPVQPARRGRWRHPNAHNDSGDCAVAGKRDDLAPRVCTPTQAPSKRAKTPSWLMGEVRAAPCASAEDSEDPLTSGDEAVEEEAEATRTHVLQLPSLEESWARLRSARPVATPPSFQKRWKRVAVRGSPAAPPEHDAPLIDDLVAI